MDFLHDHWLQLLSIATLIFNGGIMFKSFKDKPNVEKVEAMIEAAFENHCPFTSRIEALEAAQNRIALEKDELAATLKIENEQTHLSLQELKLNLKRLCLHWDIEYLKQ